MTKWQTIILSLCSAITGGAIVAICFLYFVSNSGFLDTGSQSENGAGAGYEMLEELQCGYGETKHIFINGLDDNFTLGNEELGKKSPRLAHMLGHPSNSPHIRNYDESGQDKNFVDYFVIPPKVTQGVFVTRILPKDDYGNDYIVLGDFSAQAPSFGGNNKFVHGSWLNEMSSQGGWNQHGAGLYSAQLNDIMFKFNDPYSTVIERKYDGLLAYLQGQKKDAIIEVMILDDTVVDFTGIAICTEPKAPLGLTFYHRKTMKTNLPEFDVLTCSSGLWDFPCNPIYGDTLCSEFLPVACFNDVGLPVPDLNPNIQREVKNHIQEYWSGGLLNFTRPVKGQDLKTLQEANNLCAREFGNTWRVLDYHDGGVHNVVSPSSNNVPQSRFWVDIKDQPKGTCWSRENKASSGNNEASP